MQVRLQAAAGARAWQAASASTNSSWPLRGVIEATAGLGLTLILEPGRFLVAEAGLLLARVLYRKRSGGKEYVITDAGMNALIDLTVDGGEFVVAGLSFGNVFVGIQPPRGFGENPIAIYHDPDLPPTHHYLAAY